MKPQIDISISREATDEQLAIVEQVFSEHFEVSVSKNILRFSEFDLPLAIAFSINLVSAVSWDLIKLSAQTLFRRLPPRDAKRATVEIHQRGERNVIISQSKVIIINVNVGGTTPEEKFYDSLDTAIEALEELDSK